MARGGQRGYGNAGRSAYSGTSRGGQSRAVFAAAGVSPPAGFTLNGASNTAAKAMLARVRAGTGRGRIVWKSDSTGVGQGGGAGGGNLVGARTYRPAAIVASLLSAAGIPARDSATVGGSGTQNAGVSLSQYDPRVGSNIGGGAASGGNWGLSGGPTFAGSDYLTNGGETAPLAFSFDNIDTFEIVYYDSTSGTLNLSIDGAAPATGAASVTVASTSALKRVTVKAASVGSHVLRLQSPSLGLAIRGVMAYNSAQAAIDQFVHASCGATSADQAAAGNWLNNDSLGFDAPDVTIIALGYNDQNANTPFSTIQANIQAIITKAKLSGDVLIGVQPRAATGTYSQRYAEYRAGMLALGASNSASTLDLGAYFGNVDLTPRYVDGIVHPNAGLYADEGAAFAAAIRAMAA